MLEYPIAKKTDGNNGFFISVPDFPEISANWLADFDSEHQATARAELREAIERRMIANQLLPYPNPSWEDQTIALDVRDSLKVAIYNLMKTNRMKRSDLAEALGWSTRKISEALDLSNFTRTETLEEALAYFGYRVQIRLATIR